MKLQKCENCRKRNFLAEDTSLCWSCNDDEILKKYHSPINKSYDHVTGDCVQLNPSEVAEKDLGELTEQFEASKKVLEEGVALMNKLKAPKMTLPLDSSERKNYPLFRGCLKYFSAALAGVSRTSWLGNEKHNPGEELHHARGKSSDHGDCILRHLMDVTDLLAARERGAEVSDQQILDEVNQFAWRALAFSQELHESMGAPMAPGARESK